MKLYSVYLKSIRQQTFALNLLQMGLNTFYEAHCVSLKSRMFLAMHRLQNKLLSSLRGSNQDVKI